MSLRIHIADKKLQNFYRSKEDFAAQSNGMGWPKGTWFQQRLRYVREQQRKRGTETEFVYECSLGTIRFRQSNFTD
jgi:hypothetical protein